MHIIRLDIDRKNSAEHLQVGPLGCGLNAVYATAAAGSAAMTKFIKGLLFRGPCSNELNYDEEAETIDGSLQWVDASGHVRMMSCSGGSQPLPSRFVHSPLHPSERPIHSDDQEHLRGLGNIFWGGDDQDSHWDELRGDILGMVFCSPLGIVSPEKLWWAASRIGVHSAAKSRLDEGYHRLKAEEQELQDRLRNTSVDRDRAWWSIERDRLGAELARIQEINQLEVAQAPTKHPQPNQTSLQEKLVSLQVDIIRLRAIQQASLVNEANVQLNEQRTDHCKINSNTSLFDNVSLHNSAIGKTKSICDRTEHSAERQRLQSKIEQLLAEQAGIEIELRNSASIQFAEPARVREDVQLRQQIANADEMLHQWDRRAQNHRRLAEVQSHLRTRSPYRQTTEGSLIPVAEKYLRELTAGAARQLPPWAVEASYRHPSQSPTTDFQNHSTIGNRHEQFLELPSENTRQRKLVDLAIRLAIAEAAVHRIGRIPMLIDDSLGGFRGEALEQILHVLSAFSRDGRQLLLSTNDEYTARRIAAHGGTVSRIQEIMRYARPNYILDGQSEVGLHPALETSTKITPFIESRPLRIVRADSPDTEILELNRQLTGLANEQALHSWWLPGSASVAPSPMHVGRSPAITRDGKRFYLYETNPVEDAPCVNSELVRRLNAVGIYRVADLLKAHLSKLADSIRVDLAVLDQIRNASALMCGTPQLRAFDAQVLVGCGITNSNVLSSLSASELVHRVQSFLSTIDGQDLLRSATEFEVARIHTWIGEMQQSNGKRPRAGYVSVPSDQNRRRDRSRRVRPEPNRDLRPRIIRSDDHGVDGQRANSFFKPPVGKLASDTAGSQWKFHLDIDSPVVDAPSIGPRIAERLAPLNIRSVGDLIATQVSDIVTHLADRNVTAETIQQWQQQALLVCRIPNLRGHDAQLIVGCGLTSAEQLAATDPSELYSKVVRLVSSKPGLRILRGSNPPDREEVANWIQWAQNCRGVKAA